MELELAECAYLLDSSKPVIPVRWTSKGMVFTRFEDWGPGGVTDASWRLVHPKYFKDSPESLIKLIGEPPISLKIPAQPKRENLQPTIAAEPAPKPKVRRAAPVINIKPVGGSRRRKSDSLGELGDL